MVRQSKRVRESEKGATLVFICLQYPIGKWPSYVKKVTESLDRLQQTAVHMHFDKPISCLKPIGFPLWLFIFFLQVLFYKTMSQAAFTF